MSTMMNMINDLISIISIEFHGCLGKIKDGANWLRCLGVERGAGMWHGAHHMYIWCRRISNLC